MVQLHSYIKIEQLKADIDVVYPSKRYDGVVQRLLKGPIASPKPKRSGK